MSAGVQQQLYFLTLPDLKKLISVTLTLPEDEDLRSRQIKTSRELILLYSDILASPALDSLSEITVVMAIPFFQKGIVQMFAQRRSLQLSSSQCVFPGVLQCCVSYSLITRLAPSWNKAGLYLIAGKDFLTESGRLNAVSMELSTSEGQLCISIVANTVRLPPTTLEDFDLPPLVLRRFCSDPHFVLDPSSTGSAIWCHVLPSMKKGQIITITRQLPRDGPFRTYRDLQNHWNRLYGYRLPELAEEQAVYCSVYFKLVGQRLFTYPLSCVRLQPVQRCPRVDLQGALGPFLSHIRDRLQSVCGFPARLTGKPRYPTASLSMAATVQVMSGDQINLSTSSSVRPVLTTLPPVPRPLKPYFGSQPPAQTPLSQRDGAQGILGNGCGLGGRLTQSQGYGGDGDRPSLVSSSSSRVSFSFSDSSGYQTASSLSSSSSSSLFQPTSSLSSSSSSSSSLFQPASSLSSFSSLFQPASSLSSSSSLFQPASSLSSSSSSSSSVLHPLPPPPTPVVPALKLVPIFRNKCPSHHINIAQLRAQKQREQLSERGEERGRMTLPAFMKKTPTTASSFSSSASVLSAASLTVPRFNRRPKPQGSAAPQPTAARPRLNHVFSLSPASNSKPGVILTPKPAIKLKQKPKPSGAQTSVTLNSEGNAAAANSGKVQPSAAPLKSPEISNKDASNSSSKEGVAFESKPKKSKSAVRDVDVEQMARSNQLSKVNSVTLLAWLRGRGVPVSGKHRKEELMLKVMACLAEA
ncbi:mucin-5AC isoform X2 [Sander lucioperca]|nr:mucin-5AC isoform X2 [Sander lucioperca]